MKIQNWIVLSFFSVGLFIILIYNQLVRLKALLKEAVSGMDVQFKRRHDLVPNLLEAVKGYQKYEADVLRDVTLLR